jgi:hypothetical protein
MSITYIPAALRKLVYDRANGRCEYCLIPEMASFAPHEIDHIIAEKHGGLTVQENLALSCTLCNKHKGSDLASVDAETGKIVALYNPRQEHWQDHFKLVDAEYVPLTAIGRVTVKLLHINRLDRIRERRFLIEVNLLTIPVS